MVLSYLSFCCVQCQYIAEILTLINKDRNYFESVITYLNKLPEHGKSVKSINVYKICRDTFQVCRGSSIGITGNSREECLGECKFLCKE